MNTKICGECVHFDGRASCLHRHRGTWGDCEACSEYTERNKPTNGDRIRAMSDEELAELLVYEQVVIKNIQINDSDGSHNKGSYMKMWKSALLPTNFCEDKQKVLEATLEELKKEVKDE